MSPVPEYKNAHLFIKGNAFCVNSDGLYGLDNKKTEIVVGNYLAQDIAKDPAKDVVEVPLACAATLFLPVSSCSQIPIVSLAGKWQYYCRHLVSVYL